MPCHRFVVLYLSPLFKTRLRITIHLFLKRPVSADDSCRLTSAPFSASPPLQFTFSRLQLHIISLLVCSFSPHLTLTCTTTPVQYFSFPLLSFIFLPPFVLFVLSGSLSAAKKRLHTRALRYHLSSPLFLVRAWEQTWLQTHCGSAESCWAHYNRDIKSDLCLKLSTHRLKIAPFDDFIQEDWFQQTDVYSSGSQKDNVYNWADRFY